MNPVIKYLFFGLVFIAGIFLLWFFRSVFLFIAISAVLSLVIRPLVDFIKRFKIRTFQIGSGWAALFTVLIVWTGIVVIFWFTIPLIGNELTFLSNVDIPTAIEHVMQMLFQAMEPFRENNAKMVMMLEAQIKEIAVGLFDFGKIGSVFSTMFDFLGGLFIATFSITFITFFFLKEEGLLTSGIMMFIPEHHEAGLKHAMQSIRYLLRRYFIGIILQTILIALLVTVGFYLIGIEINHAIVVGLISGLLNIIPYLGPLIGAFFGTLVGLIIYLQTPMQIGFLPLLIWIAIIYAIVQLMDNLIFQPLIFSNSVKAHPLEIFIVILAAGYLSGIVGMFLAIPVYTILRVVGREFFYNYRLVQKLTGGL
jgi:predicted PurR-regulated permease PerM